MNEPIHRPIKLPGRRMVLTKRTIETAIENTNSQSQAARWIGISYNTYKKWAKTYTLWEQHKNPSGKGIRKGRAIPRIKMEDIFSGAYKSTYYTKSRIKRRLIDEGYTAEECAICKWNEQRLTDQKICLNIDYVDGNSDNKNLENMRLLCPNCFLSNNGFFHSSKHFCK